MIRLLTSIGLVSALFAPSLALADATAQPPPTITVTGTGSISYSPDVARLSLGVREQAATAAAAADSVNVRARAVIAGIEKAGVAAADIATTGYDISYQEPNDPPVQVIERKPLPSGYYVADETIDVKTSVAMTPRVLDAALAAGADESSDIEFDTSMRESLSREALAKAVADARAQAGVIASAAGVTIVGVQSIVFGQPYQPVPLRLEAMAPAAAPPIQGGTQTIDASVQVVYVVK
jgi:uncharacterized protein